jgi:hypothetical protein
MAAQCYTRRIEGWRHLASALIVILLAAMPAPLAAAEEDARADASSRVLSWEGSPEGVTRIQIRAGNGTARIRAVDGDEIRIRLRLATRSFTDDEPWRGMLTWFFRSDYEDDHALERAVDLQVRQKGSVLVVNPLPHGRSRESQIAEHWELEVPRPSAIDIAMDAAEIEVSGVAGGVELELGHGKAAVDVPRGPLDLEVTVGELDGRFREGDFGRLSLASRVGATRLWLNGNRVRYPRPPGPGSGIAIEGDGPDALRLRVEVGDATLRVH